MSSGRDRTSRPRKGAHRGLATTIVLCLALAGTLPAAAQDLDWAKRAGGTSLDEGRAIATDGAGNSHITANFAGTATFGPGEPNQTTLTAAGGGDILVAKYDPSGALLWAKRAGGSGPSSDQGLGIAADGAGNSYVTGNFSGTATFGPGEPNQTTLTSAGSGDIFVARYDPSGALLWAKRAGGTSGGEEGFGIATDGAGNSYVSGLFTGTATFGPGEVNETTLTAPAGSGDMFVARYDSNGALVWAKRAGGGGADRSNGLAIDSAGNSYVIGNFSGMATFGPGEANETTLTALGGSDFFIAKYDPSGALVWARPAGGTGTDQGLGIATDGAGNSYVDGLFSATATFGAGETNQTVLTAAGNGDIFVASYDPNGALVWAKRAGGTGFDRGHGIARDGSGNSYVTGLFSGTATFGAGEANETTLTAAGDRDIFVAQYDPSGALAWVRRAGATGDDQGLGIAADSAYSYVTGHFRGTVTFGAGEPNQTTLTAAGDADIFVARLLGVPDADGDGIADADDNCPDHANPDQIDTDEDGDGDACDADDDNDTVADAADNCPLDPNPDQADADGDGAGNVCDADLDGDGVQDDGDACVPTATGEVVNSDGCSIAQLCPCDNAWKNHGAYVSCVAHASEDFVGLGLITEAEKDATIAAAGESQCGNK